MLVKLEATAAAGNKSFTVPTGAVWRVAYARLRFISSATAGARRIAMRALNESSTIFLDLQAGATVDASLTTAFQWVQGVVREGAIVNGVLLIPLPSALFLPEGHILRFMDTAAIDAAGDTLEVRAIVEQFDAHVIYNLPAS